MGYIKYIFICLIFFVCYIIGNLISKKYTLRLKELEDFLGVLNILESKIKFTYETLPEIFLQISKLTSDNMKEMFVQASRYLKNNTVEISWNKSLENLETNMTKEDIESIKTLGKMLGQTDKDGQISQIELTKTFIITQIDKAKREEEKNSKLYKTLGTIVGLAFVIILI